jgi:hypothetical protein
MLNTGHLLICQIIVMATERLTREMNVKTASGESGGSVLLSTRFKRVFLGMFPLYLL